MVLVAAMAVMAQTKPAMTPTAPASGSACYDLTYTKGVKGEYKKLLKIRCDIEIRKAQEPATPVAQPTDAERVASAQANERIAYSRLDPTSVHKYDVVGAPAYNGATKKLMYREEKTPNGFVMDASQPWAKHVEKMAETDRKKAVGVEKAKNPTCGWACQWLSPPIYGGSSYYGSYGYGSGYYGSGCGGSYGGCYHHPEPGGARVTSVGQGGANITFYTGR